MFGHFLEIEGQDEDIKKYVSCLGLQWSKRILLNYLEIFHILKTDKNLDFGDVTFDNFKNIDADIADYLNVIEVHGVVDSNQPVSLQKIHQKILFEQ